MTPFGGCRTLLAPGRKFKFPTSSVVRSKYVRACLGPPLHRPLALAWSHPGHTHTLCLGALGGGVRPLFFTPLPPLFCSASVPDGPPGVAATPILQGKRPPSPPFKGPSWCMSRVSHAPSACSQEPWVCARQVCGPGMHACGFVLWFCGGTTPIGLGHWVCTSRACSPRAGRVPACICPLAAWYSERE
jgi:hypothetical protein